MARSPNTAAAATPSADRVQEFVSTRTIPLRRLRREEPHTIGTTSGC